VDLTFAPRLAAGSSANVRSITPRDFIFAGGPTILTFAKVPAEK
jgi:hypothetical protein